ncbi:MAG: glucose-6-phosphate dehydrogenase [Verrucomicrobia bacterium]|nr:glucose-6-phosphate dehydrogenase [Verrucomicrobiota bacterium]MCH8512111.1 glucose-6-phosphate dehydrogenase [Kiritimatiellia bacterium]
MSRVINIHHEPDTGSRLPEIRVEHPLTLVIFGGTGDLTRRKLLPALYALATEKRMPEAYRIVGCGRRDYTSESYRDEMLEEIKRFRRVEGSDADLKAFVERIDYFKGELDDSEAYDKLNKTLSDKKAYPTNRLFYLSTSPEFFGPVIGHLKKSKLIYSASDPDKWSRVVIEKPFGRDLESALALNREVLRLLNESQVYRIDHYLGKETVQNILSFRFANTIFEPLFNNRFVDHIQVTASETVGMESGRGAYFDQAGSLRDMMQNHLTQLLCLVTMEPPSGLASDAVRNEKVKVLQSIRVPKLDDVAKNMVRAQYAAGQVNGKRVSAYVDEERVPGDSRTETYVAAKFFIDNWRWSGVPVLLRTGKRMAKKQTSITVQFKKPPMRLFRTVACSDDICDLTETQPNVLTFRIQPDEGISLHFATKRPSMHMVVEDSELNFGYADNYRGTLPEAYERLLMDVMRGDATLFTRSDEVDAAWQIMDPILRGWKERDVSIPLHFYAPGSWGPLAADQLFQNETGHWRNE